MTRYIARRLLLMIPVLIGTTFIIYVAVYALPGNPVQALAGPNTVVTPAMAHAIRQRYDLSAPLLVQYGHYLVNLLHGNFGVDFSSTPISAIIASSWPVTFKLGLTAWVLQGIIGVALGTVAAVRQQKLADFTVLTGTTIVIGVPYFVIAYVVQIVFGVKLGWLPATGITDGWPRSYLLPALVLSLLGLPEVARVTRAGVLENLHAGHVDTAVAKGLRPRHVVVRHVLRNALVPIVSLMGLSLGTMLSGTVLIEGIFSLPGLGYQVFNGIQRHDGPVVVGISTLLVLVFLAINLIVDLLYGVLDPRIRVD
jgi:ABC-type dipeptide/oligopeptide/nickel transport system permease component